MNGPVACLRNSFSFGYAVEKRHCDNNNRLNRTERGVILSLVESEISWIETFAAWWLRDLQNDILTICYALLTMTWCLLSFKISIIFSVVPEWLFDERIITRQLWYRQKSQAKWKVKYSKESIFRFFATCYWMAMEFNFPRNERFSIFEFESNQWNCIIISFR